MKMTKKCSKIALFVLILSGVITATAHYYYTNQQSEEVQKNKHSILTGPKKQTHSLEENNITNERIIPCINEYKTYIINTASFKFPCTWKTNVTNKTNWSEVGTLVSPDSTASFHYPGPDFGLDGMQLLHEGNTTVDGASYPTAKYSTQEETIVFIYLDEYNIMYAYTNNTHTDELEHILDSFQLNNTTTTVD